jgi:hypothetical protein
MLDRAKAKRALRCRQMKCIAYHSKHIGPQIPKKIENKFLTFEHLVSKLTHFLHYAVDMFVRPRVPIRNKVPLIVYRLS